MAKMDRLKTAIKLFTEECDYPDFEVLAELDKIQLLELSQTLSFALKQGSKLNRNLVEMVVYRLRQDGKPNG